MVCLIAKRGFCHCCNGNRHVALLADILNTPKRIVNDDVEREAGVHIDPATGELHRDDHICNQQCKDLAAQARAEREWINGGY
jgi:hypothetical protein